LEVYYHDAMCEIRNILFFPWCLQQTCNRKFVPNLNFKGIVRSVLFFLRVSLCLFSAFWWLENAISGHCSFF